ncbi:SIMPL domain-containing protein [Planctomyces sp. SH-PL62]|uniref:SIMPL domain-containing protein n=1 Tax=Planctomyces sp. SH-PL62 TaxID=1636152 RepID=UPI00078CE3CD|nr:SIMPL domain-containing protein [Planctomyces sp. SH-PL62]AMV41045.1 hypothetical protein VT85_26655 [Planctomyces sp. SH-PL62]
MKPPRASWKSAAHPPAWLASAALACAFVGFGPIAPSPAAAQVPAGAQEAEGLWVLGKGTASARPSLVEIDLDVSAAAELTGDAIVKFRDAKKRVHDAFAALKLPGVTIDERGLLLDQKGAAFNPYMMDYGVQSKARSEVQLSRKLVVKATGIQAMEEEAVLQLVGRLLDVAQDAGAHVGPPGNAAMMAYRFGTTSTTALVRFVVEDHEALREQAYAKAAADARGRAERLARLNGVTLGPVLSVREVPTASNSGSGSSQSIYALMYGIAPSQATDDDADDRLTTAKFQEVPIHVELQVRFAIAPVDPKTIRSEGIKP